MDIVVDPVGSDRMTDSLRSLAPEGRLLVLGFAGGEIPVVKANRLLLGNTGVLGVASREFFEQRPAIVAELWTQLMDLRRTGALADPPVEAYPFADARGALRAIADRKARGKIVLSRRVDRCPTWISALAAGSASTLTGCSMIVNSLQCYLPKTFTITRPRPECLVLGSDITGHEGCSRRQGRLHPASIRAGSPMASCPLRTQPAPATKPGARPRQQLP